MVESPEETRKEKKKKNHYPTTAATPLSDDIVTRPGFSLSSVLIFLLGFLSVQRPVPSFSHSLLCKPQITYTWSLYSRGSTLRILLVHYLSKSNLKFGLVLSTFPSVCL